MYSETGWYLIDDGQWVHMKGRCDRVRRSRKNLRMWIWKASPNGPREAVERATLRDAKNYVEENGIDEREIDSC